jgi:protein-arginine kinase activator protein McsA
MNKNNQPLSSTFTRICENCGKQNPTCHFVGVMNGVEQSRLVCWDCYQSLVNDERKYIESHCRYCGESASVVHTDIEEYTHGEPTLYMCEECSIEFNRVFQGELNGLLHEMPQCMLLDQILDVHGHADKYMRVWVSKLKV